MARKRDEPAGTAFVVRRVIQDSYCLDDIPPPEGQYLATFRDRTAAKAHAEELDRGLIRSNPPARPPAGGTPFDQGFAAACAMPEDMYCDWLMDGDIEPPAPAPRYEPKPPRRNHHVSAGEWDRHLRQWYAAREAMTPEQRAAEQARFEAGYNGSRWRNWW